jgi:hypothetical protein
MTTQNQANDDNQSTAETARLNRSNPTTSTGSTNSTTSENADLPGRRLKNPLGDFASYTYQLSLYMVTPDAYQLFIESGRKNINALQNPSGIDSNTLGELGINTNQITGGAFIVAQSGGINPTNNRRAPGMNLDYYIDDLIIKHNLTGPSTESAINITSMKFSIIEQYGFSFNTQLMRAFETIKKNSKIKNYQDSGNQYRQNFILGIRFQGYTPDGKPATPDNFFSSDTFNPSDAASGVFERFFDITITSIKFKIDGSTTKYAVEASTTAPAKAFNQKYGVLNDKVPITAATVEEALTSLKNSLNKNQQGREVNIQYEIEYLGDAGPIKNASMINPGDTNKAKRSGSTAQTSAGVNEATASTATANNTQRIIQINNGTSVAQAIEQIIKQSSYLRDAVTMTYTTNETPNPNTKSPDVVVNKNPKDIQWYNLGARVETLAWDTKVGDFSYKITYVIQPYKTPSTYTPYGKASPYYGPHKRYNYWFTGKNSEIIEYTQQLDNLYYNVIQTPSSDPNSPYYLKGIDVPSFPNQRNDFDRTNSLNVSLAAENQYLTSLYSPSNWAEATIRILGDPDYLMNDSPGSLNEVYRAYYGNDGFTINPNSGQVFIEISFNEGTDYNNNTGLLNVNEKILFWPQPNNSPGNPKINGIAYLVREVESTFSGGSFTQKLWVNHSTVPYMQTEKTDSNAQRENTSTPAGNNRTGSSQGETNGTIPAQTTPTAGSITSQGSGYSVAAPVNTGIFKTPTLSPIGLNAGYGSTSVGSSLGFTGTFLDGRQQNLVNDDAALSVGAGTTQLGKVDITQSGIGSTKVTGSVNGGVTRSQSGIGSTRVTGSVNGGVTR